MKLESTKEQARCEDHAQRLNGMTITRCKEDMRKMPPRQHKGRVVHTPHNHRPEQLCNKDEARNRGGGPTSAGELGGGEAGGRDEEGDELAEPQRHRGLAGAPPPAARVPGHCHCCFCRAPRPEILFCREGEGRGTDDAISASSSSVSTRDSIARGG